MEHPGLDGNERLPSLDIDEAGGGPSSRLVDGDGLKTSPLHAPASADGGTSSSTNLPLLTACYLSALTTGATTYAFSFYSSALKSSLRLSQNQLDTLSSATFCAGTPTSCEILAISLFSTAGPNACAVLPEASKIT